MLNNSKRTKEIIKATIENILVAFIYSIFFLMLITNLFKNEIREITNTINLISIKTNNKLLENVKLDLESKNLLNYPEYGSEYAKLSIPSLNISMPVYYGDTLTILKYGIGHSSGSYFPGEGGSILYMGHNTRDMLGSLKDITNNEKIIINTSYGTYTYTVYDTKIINYQDLDAVAINRDEEILMLYTCYNSLRIGHTPDRFVVYAKLESEELN